jgi:hypothetical protein
MIADRRDGMKGTAAHGTMEVNFDWLALGAPCSHEQHDNRRRGNYGLQE